MRTNSTGHPIPNRFAYIGGRAARRKQLVGRQALYANHRRPAEGRTGSRMQVPGPLHGLQIAVPRWSPDGKTIAFIGGLMSDQGSTGGDVWTVSAEGGEPRNLTSGRPTSRPSGSNGTATTLYLSARSPAAQPAHPPRAARRSHRRRASAPSAHPIFTYPRHHRRRQHGSRAFPPPPIARSLSSAPAPSNSPPKSTRPSRGTVMTSRHSKASCSSPISMRAFSRHGARLSRVSWNSDGFHVQGWLMLPKPYDPSKKYPLIVEVHGGPAAVVMGRWGGRRRNQRHRLLCPRLFRAPAQSARQLRTGRSLYPGQP